MNITLSDSCFEDMIIGNRLYVDKTEYLWSLIASQPKGIYFLSRPRRFGKSLTVSTLEAIFQGEKELFKGLAIYDKYDWEQTYPVIHLDLSDCDVKSPDALIHYLVDELEGLCELYQVDVSIDPQLLGKSFGKVIRAVATKSPSSKVIILIDEYDMPILNNIINPDVQKFVDVLKGFYSAIKKCIKQCRFVFITGVSKFSHVSIFSGLNNLEDISMRAEYATMLGYTQSEFEKNFQEYIDQFTPPRKSRKTFLKEIKNWYNGFCFSPGAETVYNPVSIAMFFVQKARFGYYWSETGAPAYLPSLAKLTNFDIEGTLSDPLTDWTIGTYDISKIPPKKLLWQAGYLTIKSSKASEYKLGFSNREVTESFRRFIVACCTGRDEDDVHGIAKKLRDSVSEHNLKKAYEILNTLFAKNSYMLTRQGTKPVEANFQTAFFNIFMMSDFDVESETCTNNGRIDAVLPLKDHIYIFDFKLNQDDTGMKQIIEKEYYRKYLFRSKPITLCAINFDTESGKIIRWDCCAVVQQDSGEISLQELAAIV